MSMAATRAVRVDTNARGPWWPSAFGAEDQLGMLNHITDATRREALGKVRAGRLYDLGRILDEHVPVFPGKNFHQTLVTTAHHVNAGVDGASPTGVGDNSVNWVIDVFSGTTQLGTHLDALSHLQIGDRGYNGWSVAQLAEAWGVTRLGVETVPQIVTRGWLVDVCATRGLDRLDAGAAIGIDDVRTALEGEEPEPGDALLSSTGVTDPAGVRRGESSASCASLPSWPRPLTSQPSGEEPR
ncbi:MAG: cyclase family protein [Actinomycetota bacterium]